MRDRYAVVGSPVAHSRSPWIHAEFARAAGGKGLNVTLPFKEAAFRYCGRGVSARARAAQAVNTLVFNGEAFGDNTDGVGLVTDMTKNLGVSFAGISMLLMGAGGAAQGVVQSLIDAGVGRLVIANRTVAKAEALACDGLGMLAEQAAESFFIWRGVRPETRSVLERLRAAR